MATFIKNITSGDPQSIVEFYKIYSPKILSYLQKRLPTNEDAQEVTNDVFLAAIDSLPLLERNGNLQAWLYKIAHNKTVDYYRKILKLHYEDKIPVKELAIIFNLSFKATESLLFRARQGFKLAYERA